jgi:hypothetical protein
MFENYRMKRQCYTNWKINMRRRELKIGDCVRFSSMINEEETEIGFIKIITKNCAIGIMCNGLLCARNPREIYEVLSNDVAMLYKLEQ